MRHDSSPATSKAKRLAFGLLLTALLGSAALGLAELALRVFGLAPTDGLGTVTAADFDRIPGLFAPSTSLIDRRNAALPHRTTIDSLGYRGVDFPRQKGAGEFRILFIGDSFVYGDFVNDDETMPAQLEQQLARTCRGVRVINAGLPGSTIVDQRHMLDRGLPLAPDLVLLSFTENDVADLGAEPLWDGLARNRAAKSRFPLNVLYPVVRRSALWNALLSVQGRRRAGEQARAREASPEAAASADSAGTLSETEQALRVRYDSTLATIAGLLASRGVPFVFTAFPAHLTVLGQWSTNQIDWVHDVARRHGVPDVRLLEALRRSGKSELELYLLPHDGHPSGLGYRIAALELSSAIAVHPALAGRCQAVAK